MIHRYTFEVDYDFSGEMRKLMEWNAFNEHQIISICRVDKNNYEVFVKD